MRTAFSHRSPRGRCALALGNLGLIVAVVSGGDVKNGQKIPPAGAKTAKREMEEAAKMVEAIANHNKPPKIVERRNVHPRWFPLYSKDYDWKEESRVRAALYKLYEDSSAAGWEACVQKVNDRRYCVVFYSGSSDDAEMSSVGDICHILAYHRLCLAFEEPLPSLPPHGCPIQLEEVRRHLPDWRKARKDKSLYQLQIEVCELAIREIPKLDSEEYPDKEKAQMRKKIEAAITKLRRTKKPVIKTPSEGFSLLTYPEWAAKRVREAIEKDTLEDLEIMISK